jgi:hypothetical protein
MVKQIRRVERNRWYLPRTEQMKAHRIIIESEMELDRLKMEWKKLSLEGEELALKTRTLVQTKPQKTPPIEVMREAFLMEESVCLFIDTHQNGMEIFNKLFASYKADPLYFLTSSRFVTSRRRTLFYIMREAYLQLQAI